MSKLPPKNVTERKAGDNSDTDKNGNKEEIKERVGDFKKYM